jgi:hypothetical protein
MQPSSDDEHMSDSEPTQRLRTRPAPLPPLPGPLNPIADWPRRPAAPPAHDPTEVLSLDELMTAGADPETVVGAIAPVDPVAPAAVTPATVPPAAAEVRARVAPHTGVRAARPAPVGSRLRSDAATAWTATRRRGEDWLRTGDHAVAAATVLVTVILLIVVAAL